MKDTHRCLRVLLTGLCSLVVSIAGSRRSRISADSLHGLPGGYSGTLPCGIRGIGARRIKWTQTNAQGNSREVQPFTNNPDFTFTNLKHSDQGIYTCTVEGDGQGSAPAVSKPVTILITHSPEIRITSSGARTTKNGETIAEASCEMHAESPIIMETVWYRIDIKQPLGYEMIEVTEDEKLTIQTEGSNYSLKTTLSIKNVTIWVPEHYVCAVGHHLNAAGNKSVT